jgi:hypothetical protein
LCEGGGEDEVDSDYGYRVAFVVGGGEDADVVKVRCILTDGTEVFLLLLSRLKDDLISEVRERISSC